MKKILVIQTAFLGDVILTTPFIRALNITFPKSEIDILTIPGTSILFRENLFINKILHFNKRKFFNRIFSFISLIYKIRKERYDLAISIQSSLTSSFFMLLGNIPIRLGFSRQKLLTMSVPHTKGLHKIEKILRLMEPFTDAKFDIQTELFWTSNEEKKAEQTIEESIKDHKYVVGVAPGSIWATKRWPLEYFSELVNHLEKANIKIILIGGKEDNSLCNNIITTSNSDALNLAGELTVLESAALIRKLDLMITNDSAPLHMANAVKTDVIAFFGPTVRRLGFYPFRENDKIIEVDLPCRPCGRHGGNKCPERHFRCMKEIKPEMVFDKIIAHLSQKRSHIRI